MIKNKGTLIGIMGGMALAGAVAHFVIIYSPDFKRKHISHCVKGALHDISGAVHKITSAF